MDGRGKTGYQKRKKKKKKKKRVLLLLLMEGMNEKIVKWSECKECEMLC